MANTSVNEILKYRLFLSAEEIRQLTGWPESMVQDYLNTLNNFITLAGTLDVTTSSTEQTASDLLEHEELAEAHGSNGDIVGFLDLADETVVGLVKRMALLSDAIGSTASVTVSDVEPAPADYSETHVQALVDLANANKTVINQLVSDFNAAVTVLNSLITSSKDSGQMSS